MTEKEEKAIKNLKEIIDLSKEIENTTAILDITDLKSLAIVLKALEQKDKIIDLMTRFIDTELSSEHLSKVLKIEVKPLETYREDIKQFFKKKVR